MEINVGQHAPVTIRECSLWLEQGSERGGGASQDAL